VQDNGSKVSRLAWPEGDFTRFLR